MIRTRLFSTLLLLLLAGSAAFAQTAQQAETPAESQESEELQNLLSIIEQETEVATKTRMNSDYVPGIVTVLQGDELEALGVSTAGDALGMVPGLQSVRDTRVNNSVIARGIDFPFNAGNIQILVNSVPLVRADAGITSSALLIPVEQIERIEVIRGPGSVVYGDFAFMGLVNIITRKDKAHAVARVEVPRTSWLGVGSAAWQRPAGPSFSASVSRWASHDNAVAAVTARDADDDRLFATTSFVQGPFSLSAQTARRTFSPGTGTGAAPFHETTWAVEGLYQRDITKTLRTEGRLTYLHNDINNTVSLFDGSVARAAAHVLWTGARRQSWFAGADYTLSNTDEAYHRPPPRPGAPPNPLTRLVSDAERKIVGVTLQDQVDLHERVSVTLGARYDSYSDFQSRITPRVAIAWRATDRHIVKAQYAEGFRPPTFFELYTPPPPGSSPRYAFEVNATTELNYVYRAAQRVGRVTLFRSVLRNLIRPGGVLMDPDARADGVELEWTQQISPRVKVDANLSHLDTVDPRSLVGENQVSSEWLGNLALLYRPIGNLVVGARWNLIGDRLGGRGFDTFDLTVSRRDVLLPGLGFRVGARNAFDSTVTYLGASPTGQITTTTFPGRSVWMDISWTR